MRAFVLKSVYSIPTTQAKSSQCPQTAVGEGRWRLEGDRKLSQRKRLSLPQQYRLTAVKQYSLNSTHQGQKHGQTTTPSPCPPVMSYGEKAI